MLRELLARNQLVLTYGSSLDEVVVVFGKQMLEEPSRSVNIRRIGSEYDFVS